ncbi:MAG: hypothetical protein AB1483_03030 [Candidatus Zixiibacteriota bacterium]
MRSSIFLLAALSPIVRRYEFEAPNVFCGVGCGEIHGADNPENHNRHSFFLQGQLKEVFSKTGCNERRINLWVDRCSARAMNHNKLRRKSGEAKCPKVHFLK